MAKGLQIKKVVNGEIADADDINQIVEDAGNEGGSIPYDASTDQKSVDGSMSQGSTAYPWGSLFVNQEAELKEVTLSNHAAASSVLWKNLRRFIYLKDCPSTYVGNTGKFLRCNTAETAIEFANPVTSQLFTGSGTFNVPAGISQVYVTLIAGGGGGVASGGGGAVGGSAAGQCLMLYPVTVTPSGTVTVTIGAGGSAANGGDTSFGSLTVTGGTGATGTSGAVTAGQNGSGATGGKQTVGVGSGANSSGTTGGGGGGSPFGVGGDGGVGTTGSNATGYGAGGGGGGNGSNSGNGSPGFVLVQY